MKPIYSIVVPVFNEEILIEESYRRLKTVMDTLKEPYELIFVNDGSKDKTANLIHRLHKKDTNVVLINFSRNFGHQNAITAGMNDAKGDAVVVIDSDLQDPPEIILEMIKKWKDGYEVVYGKREKRIGETKFKLLTAKAYYRLLKSLTNVEIPVDTGDFRLLDRKVITALKELPEKNRYVRGLVSWVGFKQVAVEYVREERFAGETKYPFSKMLKLGIDGITAFSYKPLRLGIVTGFIFSLLSFIYLIGVFYEKIVKKSTTTGWASTVSILLFSQGIVLIILGLMGEYIGRIYDEVKDRPNYIIEKIVRSN